MIEFVPATFAHGQTILKNLRGQEKKTLTKLRVDAEALLARAVRDDAFTCLIDGEPAAIFGGASDTELGECKLWMLTTPLIEAHQIALLRWSKRFVRWMRAQRGPVLGMVDAENAVSFRWLRWIGFEVVSTGDYITMRYS